MSNLASPNGYKWLLNIIDSFSKYAVSIPMKDKQEATVVKAFKQALQQMRDVGIVPATILSDNGSEFINSSMKQVYADNNIKHILTKAKSEASHAKTILIREIQSLFTPRTNPLSHSV
jgi:transposase InsO family protein